jgi:hypothetical protein
MSDPMQMPMRPGFGCRSRCIDDIRHGTPAADGDIADPVGVAGGEAPPPATNVRRDGRVRGAQGIGQLSDEARIRDLGGGRGRQREGDRQRAVAVWSSAAPQAIGSQLGSGSPFGRVRSRNCSQGNASRRAWSLR